MKILAISGSAREASTNTAFLKAIQQMALAGMTLTVFHQLHTLPVFSPDAEGHSAPQQVLELLEKIDQADGIIISSPEYIRAIPGGLKNAIDWMVSRFEVVGKPIVLAHASHRGDDMLASLRLVLSTVSSNFVEDLFLRIPLIGQFPDAIQWYLQQPEHVSRISAFLNDLTDVVQQHQQTLHQDAAETV